MTSSRKLGRIGKKATLVVKNFLCCILDSILALGMPALNQSLKGKFYYRASNFKEIKVV